MTGMTNSAGSRRAWIVLLAVCLAALVGPVQAQGSATSQPVDVVIVLDDSVSMAYCWDVLGGNLTLNCSGNQSPPSDPNEMRYSAARLLVELADAQDRIAVIRFDRGVEAAGPGSLQPVGGPDARKQLVASIQPPTNYRNRMQTRIDLGLEKAVELLEARSGQDRAGYIILLTDGEPYPREGQSARVEQAMQRLQRLGGGIYSVALLNKANPTEFLRASDLNPTEARSADQLLLIFSSIFSEMKPGLYMVGSGERNADGQIAFHTRLSYGARKLALVTRQGDFTGLRCNGSPISTISRLDDRNIAVNVLESASLPEGTWTVGSTGPGVFVIAQVDTYPQVIHPPAANDSDPVRYAPAGKQALIVATTIGPGGIDPLMLDGNTPLEPLTRDKVQRFVVLQPTVTKFALQVGADTAPLRVARSFTVEYRPGLPKAKASPPSCGTDQPCLFEVQFEPGAEVQGVSGWVYVVDRTANDDPVYTAAMNCTGRGCSHSGFQPTPGHDYMARFLLQARSEGVSFGDWDEVSILPPPPPTPTKPVATVLDGSVDFGSAPHSRTDTLHATARVTVRYSGQVFGLIPDMEDSSCSGLHISADAPVSEPDGTYRVLLHLRSNQPLAPQTCSGRLSLRAPGADMQVVPQDALSWTVTVARTAWTIEGVERKKAVVDELYFGDLHQAGTYGAEVLRVRFAGQPPFSLRQLSIQGTVTDKQVKLNSNVAAQPIEQEGVYRVPVELVLIEDLPAGLFEDTWHSGVLRLGITQLPDDEGQEIKFRFRTPSWWRRIVLNHRGWWVLGTVMLAFSVLAIVSVRNQIYEDRLRRKVAKAATIPAERDSQREAVPPPAGWWEAGRSSAQRGQPSQPSRARRGTGRSEHRAPHAAAYTTRARSSTTWRTSAGSRGSPARATRPGTRTGSQSAIPSARTMSTDGSLRRRRRSRRTESQ